MRYKSPSEDDAVELLDDIEFRIAGSELRCVKRGRAKAWEAHRQTGASGRVRGLCEGPLNGFIVLREYTTTQQTAPIVAAVARQERARFTTRVERHDISGAVIGVRVTFLGFAE